MTVVELTERQRLILALVIHEHTETAQPVGSMLLVEKYQLRYSSATVRNELSALTDAGMLRQPHTSAGRVPTEEGYRYFVRQLMGHTDLPATTKRTISHQFYQAGHDVDRMMRLAASVLAHQSQGASLVTAPHPERLVFKHLELISTRGRQVLMVVVFTGGDVRQQMLVLAEPVNQEQLSDTATVINSVCEGMDAKTLMNTSGQMSTLGQDILKLIQDEMQRPSHIISGEVYRDGITNVLSKPEFSEAGVARNALRVLEERPLLEDLISRTTLNANIGGVQVLIGGEDTWEELRDCSMVLARYGDPLLATGTIGVLGPIRMAYGQTISTVRFVAGMLSELVIDMMAE
ncbi:MAG: heat-inducible transcription repressor HrcA [Chloroflexi bacterium]|nr:MAG: heat-inducible transcription repressor HrcA [Chloroflexota bacterium]